MCSTRIRNVSGVTKLVNVNRRNIELIVMTKIDSIFEVFDDETDAINSFFSYRKDQGLRYSVVCPANARRVKPDE